MSKMKLIMENFRKQMSNESQDNTFTYNVIEDELDGGPTVEIDGIETTFEEMIQSLEGKTLDFDDGEGPFEFSIAPFGGEAWNLIRDGLAADFVEKWAEMNGLSAKRTGAYYEGLRSLEGLMENFRKQISNESQWGGFEGGAAALDPEQRALPEMPYEEQLNLFSLIINRGDKDPKELLYHPENFQNGLSFPDLTEEDVEDILDKLELPELGDPSWQQNIVGRPAVQNEGLPEPYKQIDANSFEGELFDYLEKSPRGVNVAMMRYAFGGSSQKWTRMLQGLVTQGKLEQSGEMYRLPETPAEV